MAGAAKAIEIAEATVVSFGMEMAFADVLVGVVCRARTLLRHATTFPACQADTLSQDDGAPVMAADGIAVKRVQMRVVACKAIRLQRADTQAHLT